MRVRNGRRRLCAMVVLLLAGSSATGQGLQWDPVPGTPGAQGGSGAWDQSATNPSWLSGAVNTAWTDGSDAVFGGTGGVVGVAATGVAVRSMTVNAPGYTFTGGPITLSTPTFAANADVTLRNPFGGAAGLNKTGNGTLSLEPPGYTDSFVSGPVNVSAGGLRINYFSYFPDTITLSNGAMLGTTPFQAVDKPLVLVALGPGGGRFDVGASAFPLEVRRLSGGTPGTTAFTKTGSGVLYLSGAASKDFAGDVLVAGGTLLADYDRSLGSSSSDHAYTLTGGATLRVQIDATVGSTRRFVFAGDGGQLAAGPDSAVVFGTPGQWSGTAAVTIPGLGPVVLRGANPGLAGTVVVPRNGILRGEATGALGTGQVIVDGGWLTLAAPAAVANDVTVRDAVLDYNAAEAAGGHRVTVLGGAQVRFGSASVGHDSFDVGPGGRIELQNLAAGTLTRGGNLSLAPGTIVAQAAPGLNNGGVIANLGTANDLYFEDASGAGDNVTVGTAPGTSPWRGIAGALSTGIVTAASDFDVYAPQGITGGPGTASLGNGSDSGGVTIRASSPVTARLVGRVIVRGAGNSFSPNVLLSVQAGSELTLDAPNAIAGARGLDVQPSGRLTLGTSQGPADQTVRSLSGGGTIDLNGSTLTVSQQGGTTFSGVIRGAGSLAKQDVGALTVTGPNQYAGPTVVNGGELVVGANNAIPITSAVGVGALGTLRLADGVSQTVGSIQGSGQVVLGAGARLSAGADDTSTTIAGASGAGDLFKIGTGTLTVGSGLTLTGTLGVRGGTLRLAPTAAAQNASKLSLFSGATLDVGGLAPGGNRLGDDAPVKLAGGRLLVGAGVDGASEAVGQMRPTPGASTVEVVSTDGLARVGLTFASLAARPAGATVNFVSASPGDTANVRFATAPPSGFLGNWAIANGADFAKYDPTLGVLPFAAGDYAPGVVDGRHARMTASASIGNRSPSTLNLVAASDAINLTQAAGTTLTLADNAILKSGSNTATIAGGSVTAPATAGDVVFYVNDGDLDVASAVIGSVAVTKAGAGRLSFTGTQPNTYTGPTYVNEGELAPSRTGAAVNQAILGDVRVNGGTLRLGAAEQIADAAAVTINAGTFHLNGFGETVAALTNNGGVFETGGAGLTVGEATFNGGTNRIGAAAAAPAGPTPGAPGVSAATTVTILDGDNVVQGNITLVVGAGGLTFKGGRAPSLRLSGPGTLLLNGDVFVNDAGTHASITGDGVIDLNGKRVVTADPKTELSISARLQDGTFVKDGNGALTLAGSTFAGHIDIAGGTLRAGDATALRDADLALAGGELHLRLPIPTDLSRAVNAGSDVELLADSTITAEEVIDGLSQPPPTPGTIQLGRLAVGVPAALTIAGVNRAGVEFTGDVRLAADAHAVVTGALKLSGAVTGPGGLKKSGAGPLTLAGATPNAFGAAVVVEGGTLVLDKPAGLVAVPAGLDVKGGAGVRLMAPNQIADAASVRVSGPGSIFELNGFNETVGSLTVSFGGRVTTTGGSITADALSVATGGTIVVGQQPTTAVGLGGPSPGARRAGSAVLRTRALSTDGAAGSAVDLTNGAAVVDDDGTSPLASIRQMVVTGYHGGRWDGPGLISSTARNDAGAALGYGQAADVLGIAGAQTGTFAGQPVDATAVLVRYTLAGDADLDLRVGFPDLLRLARHYNTSGAEATWAAGDFNYDGTVTFADLLTLAKNYNGVMPSTPVPGAPDGFEADLAAAFANVPEPTNAAVLGSILGIAAAVRRRARPATFPAR